MGTRREIFFCSAIVFACSLIAGTSNLIMQDSNFSDTIGLSLYDEMENESSEITTEATLCSNPPFRRLLVAQNQSECSFDVLTSTISDVSLVAFQNVQNVFVMCVSSRSECSDWMDLIPLKNYHDVTFTLSSGEPGTSTNRSLLQFDINMLLARKGSDILTAFHPENAITWNGNAIYVMILLDDVPDTSNLLRKLWKKWWIYRSVLLRLSQPDVVSTFDMFNKISGSFPSSDILSLQKVFCREFVDLHGEEVRIILFDREPTSTLKLKEEPSSIDSYIGLDVSVAKGFSMFLNFKIKVQGTSDNVRYGEVLANKTLTGTIKDLAYRKGDVAFNGHFMMDLFGWVEFSTEYSFDFVCVVVPKAGFVPKWRSILKPFDVPFVIATAVSTVLLAATVQLSRKCRKDLSESALSFSEILSVLVSMPLHRLPKKDYFRIIVVACELWSLVVVGGFQGILVNSLTVPLAYPNINKLDELASAKMLIFSSYKTLNLFPIANNTVHQQLNRSLILVNDVSDYVRSGKERVAWTGKMSSLYMKVTKVHHIMKECPQQYFYSYVVTAGSPFLQRLNRYIHLLRNGGLVKFWEKHKNNTVPQGNSSVVMEGGSDGRELTLEDLQAPFLLHGIGLLFSSCVFVVEIVRKIIENKCSHKKRRK